MKYALSKLLSGLISSIKKVVLHWTYCGGVVLSLVVLLNTYSALAGYFFASPFPGDVELTRMGVAVAAFTFLPYCQLTFGNVSVAFFTTYASARTILLFSRINSAIAFTFSLILLWRMSQGLVEYSELLVTSATMNIPLWYVFIPIVISILLLLLACLVTFIRPEAHQAKSETTIVG